METVASDNFEKDARPRRRTWRWVACGFLLCLIGIAALSRANDLYILATQGSYTDAERVALIEETVRDLGNSAPRPSYMPVTIRGTFEWEGELPEDCEVHLTYFSQLGNSGGSYSGGEYKLPEQKEFEFEARRGITFVTNSTESFQSTYYGPFGAIEGGVHEKFVYRLTPGITSEVRVLDEAGKPAAGVRVQAAGAPHDHRSAMFFHDQVTNEEGIVMLKHINPDHFYSFLLGGPGYQELHLSRDIRLQESGNAPLEIRRAHVTHGKVINADGKPVSNVRFHKLIERGTNRSSSGWERDAWGTSNEQGEFSISQMKEKHNYDFAVLSNEGAPTVLEKVSPGDELTVELKPGIPLTGSFSVPDELLARAKEEPTLYWRFSSDEFNGQGYYLYHSARTRFADGKLHYQLPIAGPCEIELKLLGTCFVRNVTSDESDLDFVLPAPVAEKNTSAPNTDRAETEGPASPQPGKYREVSVRFTHEGEPVLPGGRLTYQYSLADDLSRDDYAEFDDDYSNSFEIPIVDAPTQFKVPEKGTIRLEVGELAGYIALEEDPIEEDIQPGDEPREIEIEVQPAGAIRGTVLDREGLPISGVRIETSEAEGYIKFDLFGQQKPRKWTVNTGVDGQFLVSPVPLGDSYDVRVESELYNEQLGRVTPQRWQPIPTLQTRIDTSTDVKVQILIGIRRPVGGLPIKLIEKRDGEPSPVTTLSQKTDSTGTASFPALNSNSPGTFFISVDDPESDNPVSQRIDLFQPVNKFYLIDDVLRREP